MPVLQGSFQLWARHLPNLVPLRPGLNWSEDHQERPPEENVKDEVGHTAHRILREMSCEEVAGKLMAWDVGRKADASA